MSRAAGSVLVVAERVVDTAVFAAQPEATLVPHFMVEAFAVVPRGAWPGSCWPSYEVDYAAVEAYLPAGDEVLAAHLGQAPEANENSEVRHG